MGWQFDYPSTFDPTTQDPSVLAAAESMAGAVLSALVGYRVGGDPITVMPRSLRCRHPAGGFQFGAPFHPVTADGGGLTNCWCRSDCTCLSVQRVQLEAPVVSVDEVVLDGAVLDPALYRVEDNGWLVRTDDGMWPSCWGDRFTVTYSRTRKPGPAGRRAAAALAMEFAKLYAGDKKCRLPSGVTAISRQGVSVDVVKGIFPDGVTGLMEVDPYVRTWNPNGMKVPPRIYSPDSQTQRQRTW